MPRFSYTIDHLKCAVHDSICYTDVCRILNITICTFSFKRIQKLCKQHNISLSHFNRIKAQRRNKFTWSPQDVFCEHSMIPRHRLRSLAMRHGLYTGTCNKCGISDIWNGNHLTIELDHKNGINDDNRIDNLQWLCPNCHSQTPTFRNPENRRVKESNICTHN